MDALLLALQNVCQQLLPIIGAVALVFLCILLKKAWLLIEQVNTTVKNLDPTIKLANQSIEKIQAPLDTAVKVSHTVDEVHDKTVKSVSKAADFINENVDHLKDCMSQKFSTERAEEPDTAKNFQTLDPDPQPEEDPVTNTSVKETEEGKAEHHE